MSNLITLQTTAIGNAAVQTCNARDLHEFLGSKAQFADWIKDRIEQYGFEEGKDYVGVFQKIAKNPQGGRPAKDYFLSLDMAKELSMVERTDKGKQARRYFIECERQAKAGKQVKIAKPSQQISEAAKVFKANYSIMRLIGCDQNGAAISANQATQKTLGVNLLELNERTHLVAENQDSLDYTPTELGMRIGGLSGRKINEILAAAGLQVQDEAKKWLPTAQAEGHYVWHDTGKAHGNGAPVKQLKWYDSVLPLIQTQKSAL